MCHQFIVVFLYFCDRFAVAQCQVGTTSTADYCQLIIELIIIYIHFNVADVTVTAKGLFPLQFSICQFATV